MAYHTARPMTYGGDYWNEFVSRDNSEMGAALTKARIDFVRSGWAGDKRGIVDIGIGGGRFVSDMGCRGFDVNQQAIQWLKSQHKWKDPYDCVDVITCWDSLEHIPDPSELIGCVNCMVFVSLPIFTDVEHIRSSRHYKPGEHIWYWTHDGFVAWMDRQGMTLIECNKMETELGREGINSYAFARF